MDKKWMFFKEISYAAFVIAASFLVKQDFFSDMLVTGLAVLVSTCKYMSKPPTKICDRKNIMILAEASMYAGYEIMACKRYISEPHLEVDFKALAIATPMIVTAYQNYKPQNHNEAKTRLEMPEISRPEEDMETTHERVSNTVRP